MSEKTQKAKNGELLRAYVKKGGSVRLSGSHLVRLTLDDAVPHKLAINPRTKAPFRIPVDETIHARLAAGEEIPVPRIWLKLGWRTQVIKPIDAEGTQLDIGAYPVFVSALGGKIERLVCHPKTAALYEVSHWTKKRHMTMG